ncbi:hypothetical protein [Acinetobacter ursingii]|uniref:Transmembrane protein n=1 Tax=Acinetobacter ursingii TaxID=108980 RepID=A0A7T9UJV1_9GAMM|nr:hypothetical protein [Acinetobacter ursingii]ECE6725757.1 hypothetical protein [Salmonella enterica subsp. enterica serovar Paratyphi A]ENX45697.1 hypothetical protein F943_03264 [Acinetobacter ursingii NIPH 706]MCU4524270.1 hypothetical protein [Acinetobacter ursingii]MCU4588471.1 hypothetical protein [Acinetobacter ursingii]QQT87108.1 hypothetical protein I6I53_04910 [Acinetobacter ursingii]
MGQNNLVQHRRYIAASYVCMFLGLFTILFAVIAYFLARKVAMVDGAEVWIHAHALWIMRSVVMFLMLVVFAALWFIPLIFFVWNSAIWVTACTVAGVIFAAVAWLYLLNAWIKGLSKYSKNKAVF